MLNVFVSMSFSLRPLGDSRSGPSSTLGMSQSCMCLCGCFCTLGRLSRSHPDPELVLTQTHMTPPHTAVKGGLTGSVKKPGLKRTASDACYVIFFFSSQDPADPICHHLPCLPHLPFQIVQAVFTQIHIGLISIFINGCRIIIHFISGLDTRTSCCK